MAAKAAVDDLAVNAVMYGDIAGLEPILTAPSLSRLRDVTLSDVVAERLYDDLATARAAYRAAVAAELDATHDVSRATAFHRLVETEYLHRRQDLDASIRAAEDARRQIGPTILGPSALEAADLVAWYRTYYPADPPVAPIETIIDTYLRIGAEEGVAGDIAFAQAILETGGFRSGHAQDFNFAGIGAYDYCAPECAFRFPDLESGVRAHIQLLRAYADPGLTSEELAAPPNPLVAPERVAARGCCSRWTALTGIWASDPNYDRKVLGIYRLMVETAPGPRPSVAVSPTSRGAPAVTVEDLVVRHGELTAVDGVSFTASAGEVLALLGPNGAGKTSTIEVLEGYGRASHGRVRVLGHDPATEHDEVVGRIGVMLQDGGVYPGIHPPEMLRLLAAMYDDPLDVDALLDRVALTDRSRTTWRQLSGGEQQRLSLAMALIGRPEVAFLDEPTSGVDVRGRQVIRQIVRELADDGVAVVLCTHELDEAEKVADRVVIVDRGHVVGAGSLAELRASTAGAVRFSSDPGIDVGALGRRLGAEVTEASPGEYVVAGSTDAHLAADLTGWLAERGHGLGDLRAGRQRLEDVFLALTSDADVPDDRIAAGERRGRRRRRS